MAMRGFTEGDTGITNWMKVGQNELKEALKLKFNFNVAKNVILFIGDGMSFTTTAATRIYNAQNRGLMGNAAKLAWEKFPWASLSKVQIILF